MSSYTDYAKGTAARFAALDPIGQPDVSFEEGYVPLYACHGPWYAERELSRARKEVQSARSRAREEQIRSNLTEQTYVDALYRAAFGPRVTVPELVGKETRVVLLGEAGAGKSTALRFLARNPLAGQDDSLTLIVNLGDWASSGMSLSEYLAADAKEALSLELDPGFFIEVLASGQALLCLDGLDEIADQKARLEIVEKIESMVDLFPRARFIVTARGDVYQPKLSADTFAHYQLLPWNTDVVDALESAWTSSTEGLSEEEVEERVAVASRLLRDILSARDVVALFADGKLNAGWKEIRTHLWDPAWRERIVLVYRFLSQDQPEVWSKAMSLMLEAGTSDEYGATLHRYLLVAAAVLAGSVQVADLNEDVRKGIVDGLIGWLEQPGAAGKQDAVDALYQLTNEPLAAQAVLASLGNSELDTLSRISAALLVGRLCTVDTDAATGALWERVNDSEEHVRVRQAATTALGFLAQSSALADDAQDELLAELVASVQNEDLPIDVRVAGTESLGAFLLVDAQASVLEALVSLARGEGEGKVSFSVQMAAARGLAALLASGWCDRDEQMWEFVRDQESDESVRAVIVEVLGSRGDRQEAAQILLEIARDMSITPPGRRDGLEALGRLGYADESIIEALSAICETHERKVKDFERLAAAKTLVDIGQLDLGLQYLLMLIADKSIYRTTRNEALSLLGEMGMSGDEDLDNAAIAVLQVWVTEDRTTEDVREHAMASLVKLNAGTEEVIRDLIGVAQDRQSYPRVRRAAVSALDRLVFEDVEAVSEALKVPFFDSEEKSDLLRVPLARRIYLWSENEYAWQYLKAAAEQSYQAMVRYRAAVVLHEFGEDELAVETLTKIAMDSTIADPIRCDAMRNLSFWKAGDQELAAQLNTIMTEEEEPMPSVLEQAYEAVKTLLAA